MSERSEKAKKPYQAFILAAGFGTRLRPYTDHCPKPMVQIGGRSLIWRIMDQLRDVGVREIVVNVHYLKDIIAQHLCDYTAQYSDMTLYISYEEEVLNTGGGVKNALQYFDRDVPFYVIAGDAFWVDEQAEGAGALEVLAEAWDGEVMDILTLMQPVDQMILTRGVGDYDLCDDGRVVRSLDKSGAYMWTNIRLNMAHIYEGGFKPDFSFLDIMDDCEKRGRLRALTYRGAWHHISTPQDLEAVENHLISKVKTS